MTFEEAILRSDIAHEQYTLEKLIEAGENLLGTEQETMGILGLVGKVVGNIFGGPIGGAVGEASGRAIGDSLYHDYKIDKHQFKHLRPTAGKASREFRKFYNDMSNKQWADFAANIGMAYIQAGGIEGGSFTDPTEIDWTTYGNKLPSPESVSGDASALSSGNTLAARSTAENWKIFQDKFGDFEGSVGGVEITGTDLFGVGSKVSKTEFMSNPLYYELGVLEGIY